ncbi:hypothetical protein AAZX31_09G084700 [Glycine max]|nr:hypothetical protein GYH30_024486 [Glycine max]
MINVAVDSDLWKPIQVGRNGPKLSHLAFANDLILFAEASLDQVEVITACLEFFYNSSGEKLNDDKTRIFFSHNVNGRVKVDISQAIGFQRTNDLGSTWESNFITGEF